MPHGSDDARKRFILATTGNFYGIEPSSSLAGSQELNNFLDDGNQFVLSVVRHDGNLHLSNTVTDVRGFLKEPSAMLQLSDAFLSHVVRSIKVISLLNASVFSQLPWLSQIETSHTEKMLVFFKLRPTVITEDNLHQSVLVSSMLDSPINTLYQAVRQVFAPALLKASVCLCGAVKAAPHSVFVQNYFRRCLYPLEVEGRGH